jgi:Flp pilus assembly pilin Flp
MRKIHNLLAREDGQTMAEYATVLTIITVTVVAAIAFLAERNTSAISRVAGFLG